MKNRYIFIILILVILAIIPFSINYAYLKGETDVIFNTVFSASDVLLFYGSILTFLGTVSLGALALWQNNKIYNDKNAPYIIISFNILESRLYFTVENIGNTVARDVRVVFNDESKQLIVHSCFIKHIKKLENTYIQLPPKQKYNIYVDVVDPSKAKIKTFIDLENVVISCAYLNQKKKRIEHDFYFDLSVYAVKIQDYEPADVRIDRTLENQLSLLNEKLTKIEKLL